MIQNRRIEYIDLAKGFCIILVVFHHANSALNNIDYVLRDAMCAFRMPLYLMLFRQNSCRKSQKGVYLHRVKAQKGVKYESLENSKRCRRHHYEA